MTIWSDFRGHADQREMLRRAVERNRLTHAYLFVGIDGIGKQLFARHMAQSLLCRDKGRDPLEACGECSACRPFLAGNHPDFLSARRPDGARFFPISLIVGTKELRGEDGLVYDLSLRPLEDSRKVAIICDVDTMNEESANAFLKTLEEPPERAVLILIASNLDAVMPTIRSRCQLVRFSPLSIQDVQELLLEKQLAPSEEEARFAAALSQGSLTLARQMLQPELKEMRASLYSALSQSGFSGLAVAKPLLEIIDKISSDTPEQRVNAQWLIQFAVEFYRSALRCVGQPGSKGSSKAGTIPEAERWASAIANRAGCLDLIGELIERSVDASDHILQNVPVPLALETMLNDLAKLSRPTETRKT